MKMLAQNRIILAAYHKEITHPLRKLPPEILYYILKLANNSSLIEKYFEEYPHPKKYGYSGHWDFNLLIKNADITPRFIEKHPELLHKINIEDFSYNPSITSKFIEQYIDQLDLNKLNFRRLSYNPNITVEFIQQNVDKISLNKWNWNLMAINPSIPPEFIVANLNFVKYKSNNKLKKVFCKIFKKQDVKNRKISIWKWLSKNSSLSSEFIKIHNAPWNMTWLSKNPVITSDIIEELNDDGYILLDQWDWSALATNPSILLNFIEKHLKQFTAADNIKYLSKNPVITPEFIKKLDRENKVSLDKWDWKMMSRNTSITPGFIEELANIHKISLDEWDWYEIFKNPSIPLAFIEKHIGRPKDKFQAWWGYISRNPNVTALFVEKHIKQHWNWNLLTKNPNITFAFIKKYPEKPWFNRYIVKGSN